MEFLTDWFVSDEGVKASPLLRKVAEIRHREHREGVVYQSGEQKADEVKSTAPAQAILEQAQADQEAKAQEQIAQQAEAAQAEAEKQETIQAAQFAFDKDEKEQERDAKSEEAEKERQHESGEKAKDREFQMSMKVLDGIAAEDADEKKEKSKK